MGGIGSGTGAGSQDNAKFMHPSRNPIFKYWKKMKARCYDKRSKFYKGDTTICNRWNMSFAAFVSDMGHPPDDGKYKLARKDETVNYNSNNCYWGKI